MSRRKVLLVEINEITWNLIDPLIAKGTLPTFAFLKREGAWAAPVSVDLPPQLDPWITWTTVYTGRPQADHNVFFLQQPPDTIRVKRIWEICHDHGMSVGVYGSLCSWPPQPVRGFYVPDTFAPDALTYPESLRPIQELNLTYTRSIRLPSDQDGIMFKLRLGSKLLRLGLRGATLARIARQLAAERLNPTLRWRRVALHPAVNFDFFERLYTRHRPTFATFHTNHVAHYMHTYWKAMQPGIFPQETSSAEAHDYGKAIEYGYRTADDLLKRIMGLLDQDTVLVVASSMGQQPFISNLRNGKRIGQLRSLDRLVDIMGLNGRVRTLYTMSDQFNIYADSAETREFVIANLKAAYIASPDRPMFYISVLGDCVTAALRPYDDVSGESLCVFPESLSQKPFRYDELVYGTGMMKSGCHHPQGMLMMYGAGIKHGVQLSECTNLNLAPTLLTLLDIPVPVYMTKALYEAFEGSSEPRLELRNDSEYRNDVKRRNENDFRERQRQAA
jgi:hypothetical protein